MIRETERKAERMKPREIYHAGLYLRLSNDDEDIGGWGKQESNSIRSQRELGLAFIQEHSDLELGGIYADDGYTGTNFDRPAFRRMMEDVQAGKIDCIIVKDLSRLGRDYIEAGRLIQKTFPAFHVRFIAITDQFDSLTAGQSERYLVVPVKNFINDSYSKDISGKIRGHQIVKRRRGDFIGAFPVYGYQKDPNNRNHLIPDAYAAEIVRNIFAWKIGGMSNSAIADQLQEQKVLSPFEYKKARGEKFKNNFRTNPRAEWSAAAVKRILVNEVYLGTLVQGKTEKISPKIRKLRARPEEEWVRVSNTHAAIVSEEEFEQAQRMLGGGLRASGGSRRAHLFSGLLFCGTCGARMVRKRRSGKDGERIFFICGTKNRGGSCTLHRISEEGLTEAILAVLKQQMALFGNREWEESIGRREECPEEAVFEIEIRRLQRERERCLAIRSDLYGDWKSGVISGEDYDAFWNIYEETYEEAGKAIGKQEEMRQSVRKEREEAAAWLERFRREGLTELDRAALLTFAERIDVYEDRRIVLKLRMRNEFERSGEAV